HNFIRPRPHCGRVWAHRRPDTEGASLPANLSGPVPQLLGHSGKRTVTVPPTVKAGTTGEALRHSDRGGVLAAPAPQEDSAMTTEATGTPATGAPATGTAGSGTAAPGAGAIGTDAPGTGATPLKQSPLHRIHEGAGATFTDFAGWLMP